MHKFTFAYIKTECSLRMCSLRKACERQTREHSGQRLVSNCDSRFELCRGNLPERFAYKLSVLTSKFLRKVGMMRSSDCTDEMEANCCSAMSAVGLLAMACSSPAEDIKVAACKSVFNAFCCASMSEPPSLLLLLVSQLVWHDCCCSSAKAAVVNLLLVVAALPRFTESCRVWRRKLYLLEVIVMLSKEIVSEKQQKVVEFLMIWQNYTYL